MRKALHEGPPDLRKALDDYALLYAKSYGAEEQVTELIPFMLDAFLKADAGFRKGRKDLQDKPVALPIPKRRGGRAGKPAIATPPEES